MSATPKLRIACWLAVFLALSWLLVRRYPAIASGTSSTADIVILLVWTALTLAPLFQEVDLFGRRLQRSIESLRAQMQSLMSSVQSQTQSVNIHNYPTPPTDSEISERRREAEKVLGAGLGVRSLQDESLPQDADVNLLFNLRRSLERELKRIASSRFGVPWDYQRFSLFQSTQRLLQAELLPPSLAAALKDVYAICSAAIHGEEMSPKQLAYAREIGPQIVSALRAI